MRVAVLGCGPAGLLAAHACALEGVGVSIFSKKRKSNLFGSQYLHEHIPGITQEDDHVTVKYAVRGTPEEYRRKVHGKWWDGHIAPEDFEKEHPAWNIRKAYDTLWEKYGWAVNHYDIPDVTEVAHGNDRYDVVNRDLDLGRFSLVVSTVPRTLWRVGGEEFIYSEGWAAGDAPEEGRFIPYAHMVSNNEILCDGTPMVSWTRLSKVFGYATIEWPHHAEKPPIADVSKVIKPLHYTPSSQNPNPTQDWLHVGRYGEWKKGVVVTDAYNDVVKKLRELL